MAAVVADPCCVAYGDHPINLSDEKVIIVWDSQRNRQHFIRQASFTGEAKDFGFIVPTPTVPEVKTADAQAYEALGNFVIDEQRKQRARWNTLGGVDAAAPAAGAKVSVIDEFQVGDYTATILQATDGTAMLEWLKKNDFKTRPAMETWLDYYAQQGWTFTALKFTRPPESKYPETSALRISFDAKTPFYPYKMPDDTWPQRHVRPMSVYFISDQQFEAKYKDTGKDWEAKLEFQGKLPRHLVDSVVKQVNLMPDDMPEGAHLTMFRNVVNKNGYSEDLNFFPQSSPYAAIVPIAAGGSVAVLAALAVTRRARTIASKPPPSDGE